MSVVAAAIVGGVGVSAYSANRSNSQAKDATNAQLAANTEAQEIERIAAERASGQLDPVANLMANNQQSVTDGNNLLQEQLGGSLDFLNQSASSELDVNKYLDPSMAYTMSEANKALEGSASARGGALSGAALKALTEQSSGIASQNYNNAFQQAIQARDQSVGENQFLAQIGQSGLQGNTNQFNAGINAIGQQASITSQQGVSSSALAQNAGAIQATGINAKQDVLGAAVNGGIGAATALFSDEDLKTGIEGISDDDVKAFLDNLAPSEYSYTDEGQSKGARQGRTSGVMAQDMEKSKMGRQLVSQDADGHRQVDVKASVGALMATNASLNKRIKKLEGVK